MHFLAVMVLWTLNHINDERKRTKVFDLRSQGSCKQPYCLEKLKRDLQRVQNLAAEMGQEQMELYLGRGSPIRRIDREFGRE